jgi:hypothetical protein
MNRAMIILAIVTVLMVGLLVTTASAQPSWGGVYSPGGAAPTVPTPLPTPTLLPGNLYIVRHGDTLSSIAARFKVNLFELARVNHIINPAFIITGQRLLITLGFPQFPQPVFRPRPVCPTCPWGWPAGYWGAQAGWGGYSSWGMPWWQS